MPGDSFNLDGSTLYLSLAAVFVAQAAGVELTIGQQIKMLLTLMLTRKGETAFHDAGEGASVRKPVAVVHN